MKRKFNSMWRIAIALVLVLSFSLVMSVPNVVRANPGSLYVDDAATFDGTVASYNGTSYELVATSAVFTDNVTGDAIEFISGTANGKVTTIVTWTDNTTVTLETDVDADISDTFNLVDLDAPSLDDPFKYIQSAITIAESNDTINVAAGTYTEDLAVATANLTLKSENGPGSTTIQLVVDVGIDIQGAANGFTLGGTEGHGFTIVGNSANTTTNIQTDNTTGVQISHNTITGPGGGIVIVSGGDGTSGLNISSNSISGCANGIWFKQNGAGDITTVTVNQNILSNNTIGLLVNDGVNVIASEFTITNNNFNENTSWGLQNLHTSENVTAEVNYWGDPTGPKQATYNPSATGDEVSDNVTYTPWLDAPGGSPRSFNVLNTDTTDNFTSIQAAINAASAKNTLMALAGTYSENITIDKPLALMSATGSANTTIDASGLGANVVTIVSANVTLGRVDAGFTITGANTTGLSGINLGGSNCRIDSNNITGNYNGIQIMGSQNRIRRNTITGNSNYGIYFVSNVIGDEWNDVQYNDITGNTEYGAYADMKTGEPYWMQGAGFNWWGHDGGPSDSGPGTTGDAVNQYVWYNPWLNDSYSTILASGIADISTAIPVKVGWNTLSTPLALDGESIQWKDIVTRSGLTNFTACTYDATNKTFVNLGTDSIVPLTPLDAVFIKVSADQKVSFKVSTSLNSPPTKQLQGSWNLIGAAMSITERELEMWKVLVSVDKTADGLIGYDMVVSPPLATQPPWVYVRGQEEATGFEWQKMDFGRGYWIYMENADEFAGFSSTPITARVWD